MHIIIFVHNMNKVPEYIRQIINEVSVADPMSWGITKNTLKIFNPNDSDDIYVEILPDLLIACHGLHHSFVFLDPDCRYEFCNYIRTFYIGGIYPKEIDSMSNLIKMINEHTKCEDAKNAVPIIGKE